MTTTQPTTLDELLLKAEAALKKIGKLVTHVVQPHPTGTGERQGPAEMSLKALEDVAASLRSMDFRDFQTLFEVVEEKLDGDLTDDKTYFMEHLIQLCAQLPNDSKLGNTLTDGLLTQLWNDLSHPPQSYLGDKFKYRSADGSNNSLVHPMLGAADTPYARSVKPLTVQPVALPDPGVIFDSIMARTEENTEEHPNKISSVLFYMASIVIHDLFRTDHNNFSNSRTSSYLDLSPLYGSNSKEQDRMRTHENGKIHPDCYSEKRLMGFPPGVSAVMMMFNRFHNYVVEQLALINEGGRFNVPVEGRTHAYAPTWEKRDEDLFQTGRLITCGLYINIILLDYVRTILNLNHTDDDWTLNPRADIPGLPVATGNQVSAEFNLVYRWHSAISARDAKWTDEAFASLFPGQDPTKVDMHTFLKRLEQLENDIPDDPFSKDRDYFHGQKRTSDGLFDDDFLVEAVTGSIEDPANSFGAQRVPRILRAVEILGIQQARMWNLATLNEFREHFGLVPHKTFEAINPDKYVAAQLKGLYEHPDLVELYPGLVAESAKPAIIPGSGLAPTFTVSRAVLSDAVALVRGDRFYTVDYHPKLLTNWGFSLISPDTAVDHGCVLYKLLLRAFPNHFESNSVYVHYPLTIPAEMERVLTGLGKTDQYSFPRPKAIGVPQVVYSYDTARMVLKDERNFLALRTSAMDVLMGPLVDQFGQAADGPSDLDKSWQKEIKAYCIDKGTKILKEKSCVLGGLNQVDVIRDVGNMVPVHLIADLFNIRLKTDEHSKGIFTDDELYVILVGIFEETFLDLDPVSSYPYRQKAILALQNLGNLVRPSVSRSGTGIGGLMEAIWSFFSPKTDSDPLPKFGSNIIQRLLNEGGEVHHFVWGYIMSTASGLAPPLGQLFGQLLELYLTEGKQHLDAMRRLALQDDDESFNTLMRYAMEGVRLGGEIAVCRRAANDITVQDAGRELKLKAGDKILVNIRAAHRDPKVFPDPDTVKTDRPLEAYLHLGYGPIGLTITPICLTSMLKVVLKECPKLQPATGPQGVVKKVEIVLGPESLDRKEVRFHKYLNEKGDSYWPFPAAMKVNWDTKSA